MYAYRVFEAEVDGELCHLRMDMISPNWLVQCLDPETGNLKYPQTILENDEDDALRFLVQELQKQGKIIEHMRLIEKANG